MSDKYILDGHTPVPCDDLFEWGRWIEEHRDERIVKQDTLAGDVLVSTVFLGLDHSFGRGKPVLFETMIFGLDDDKYQRRYSTWGDALEGHAQALAFAKERRS